MGDRLETIRLPYRLFRDTVSSADTDLAAATKTWATFLSVNHPDAGSAANAVRLAENENRVIICFDHKNADTDTAALTIYAWREGGPAEKVCSIDTITAGNQQSDLDRTSTVRYFADTIGTITQTWIGGSGAVEEVDSGGGNGVAKLKFDVVGYKYLLVLFTTISASDNVRAWITAY